MMPEDEPLRSESVQCAPGEEQRASTSSARKNEATGSKPKGHSVADVSGGERRVRCCKDLYSIGTWNVRSMNQGKLDVVKQEMTRLNIDILGISELKWTGMGKFNSDDHQVYYCGIESLRRNGVAFIVKNPLVLSMGFSWQGYWSGLPFPSPVDHVLSELSAMTCPSWVALHGMAHSFIELHKPLRHNKAVIHEGGARMAPARIQSA
ncbi:Craniofacial development protein 2 [Varanus komodoensis]|nr:Craniofacial development protein 2 [Varanus komodoensis]